MSGQMIATIVLVEIALAGLVTAPGCGSPTACRGPVLECPFYVVLAVSAPDGGAITGVQATLSGVALGCEATATGAGCLGSGTPGPLKVTAPGFQPIDVNATVTTTPAPPCGCPRSMLEPSSVTLSPQP